MLNQDLNNLAKTLSLTEAEELTPYLLTPEEEAKVLQHAVNQLKSNFMRKLQYLGKESDIILKTQAIKWEEKVDREAVLKLANTAKVQELFHKQQREKERQEKIDQANELVKYWTATQMYKLMAAESQRLFGNRLDVTDQNLPAIKALCFFLARDDRFFTELKDKDGKPYDPQKGLLIRGPTGTGKTHLIRCVATNDLNPVAVVSMIDITNEIKRSGEYLMKPQGHKIIYLDDVGTEEPVVKFYGTTIQWFKDYIETVYLKTKTFNHLIISTNLNYAAIEEKYGFRVASRMREMFNLVDLVGEDRRRK